MVIEKLPAVQVPCKIVYVLVIVKLDEIVVELDVIFLGEKCLQPTI